MRLENQNSGYCPTCGQRVLTRHGVRLPPTLVDILDIIERAGERGVLREVLAWTFFPGKSKCDAERLISVHIGRLNEHLESTNIRVSTSGRRLAPYQIVARNVRPAP